MRSAPARTKWIPKASPSDTPPASNPLQGAGMGPPPRRLLPAIGETSVQSCVSYSTPENGFSADLTSQPHPTDNDRLVQRKTLRSQPIKALGNCTEDSTRLVPLRPVRNEWPLDPSPAPAIGSPILPKLYMSPDGVANYEPGPTPSPTHCANTSGSRQQALALPTNEKGRQAKSCSPSSSLQSATDDVSHKDHDNNDDGKADAPTQIQHSNDRIQKFIRLLQAGLPPSNLTADSLATPKGPLEFPVNIETTMPTKSNKRKSRTSPSSHKSTPEDRAKRKRQLLASLDAEEAHLQVEETISLSTHSPDAIRNVSSSRSEVQAKGRKDASTSEQQYQIKTQHGQAASVKQ
ncbi:hypothetical protein R1flu_008541 [Riccia fluitans]|uniref:Uncharacterized protein n=1 Tax=Riccia fluitans TaxID=41844 RepID=A0ABD1YC09_9MARC